MEEKGGKLRVSTRPGRHDGSRCVELIVEDEGPGFPDDAGVDIFEPYVTTKVRGTGLGLAIVKKIADEHGGLVQAEPAPDGGARMIVRFPPVTVANPDAA